MHTCNWYCRPAQRQHAHLIYADADMSSDELAAQVMHSLAQRGVPCRVTAVPAREAAAADTLPEHERRVLCADGSTRPTTSQERARRQQAWLLCCEFA